MTRSDENLGITLSLVIGLAVALLFVDTRVANAAVARIWAVDDGEKVKKTDNAHPLATSPDNPVWNGKEISLFGAKNEVVAFQLIIEADASGADNVAVSLDRLTNGSYAIENSGSRDPFDYVGKRIELFAEHYVNIEKRSRSLPSGDGTKPSDQYLGWVPDALIPFAVPKERGGAPLNIAPDSNQAVWVDIWVPRDALVGIYAGNVEVRVNSVVTHTMPVSLEVYEFALPDECHLKNMFVQGGRGISDRHGVKFGSPGYHEIERGYFQMAHRHRFDIVKSVKNLTVMTDHYKGYMDGTYYTPAYNYEGPGANTGNGTFSIGPYNYRPEEFSPDDEAGWRAGSDAWVQWFKANAPGVEIHKYLRDEPYSHGAVYHDIIERCRWIHDNPGPGRDLMTYVVCPVISELQGHCDFWSIHSTFWHMPDAAYEQSQGRKCGFYNGKRPYCGTMVIDTDAIDFRVQPWICWRYHVDQYFYWQTTRWDRKRDLFIDPSLSGNWGNGGFFYPGEDLTFPESSRGLPGPLSSIRMKNWRRGMQDYEYLWLAGQSGLNSEVDAIVNRCVPAALGEADHSGQISWPSHGYGFERYRRQLAYLISGKTGTIKGRVVDKVGGDPVPGASVTDGIRSAATDARGTYAIDVVAGIRTVTASATGYEASARTGVEATQGNTTVVDFRLTRDTVPPVISNVRAPRITSTKTTIAWNTDQPSSGLVEYGTSPGSYDNSTRGSSPLTSHSTRISGLSPDTTYYYVVTSSDRSGNSAASGEYQFKTPPALDLAGLWHFDEGSGTTARDSSEHANDATLVKGPTWVDGYRGKGLEFDGADDHVRCQSAASLDSIVDEITVTAWIKPSKTNGSIVRKWDWGNLSGYHLDIDGYSEERQTLNLKIGYGDKSPPRLLGASIDLNRFIHVAFTATDAEIVLYVNGDVAQKGIPAKTIDLHNHEDVRIGGGSGWSGGYFNGVIDEVKLCGRALSADEIRADYQRAPLSEQQ